MKVLTRPVPQDGNQSLLPKRNLLLAFPATFMMFPFIIIVIATATPTVNSASAFVFSRSIYHDACCRPEIHYMRSIDILLLSSSSSSSSSPSISSEEVRSRTLRQLERLRERDRQSIKIHSNDLKIVFEDDYLVCVDKPSGLLCVPSEEGIPSLAQLVFETVDHKVSSFDKMVVHRLGMDTSGLVLFAKTMESLRGMNTLFRTRKITRKYEVLVCGHVANDSGTIDLPLMRDYVHPPFMRVSTEDHQKALMEFDPNIVGKKLLELPKTCQTKYQVLSRETLLDTKLPVTRLLLTSVTGRTHQLNVHCAAMGHPIVGDRVYGFAGDAAPNGGLDPILPEAEVEARLKLEQAIASKFEGRNMCVHARSLSFMHPVLNVPMSFESVAPF